MQDGLEAGVTDERPAAGALADVEQTLLLQQEDGLAHGGAADPEALDQLTVDRQTVARAIRARQDRLPDLAGDRLVDPLGMDGRELADAHARYRNDPGWISIDQLLKYSIFGDWM